MLHGSTANPIRSGLLLLVMVCTAPAMGQWVISSIHPDPTPYLGAPGSEFIALVSTDAQDSCISLEGLELSWNGQFRPLPDTCLTAGTVIVAHRASDSLDFDFGPALSIPMASWPALVNGGGTVILADVEGTVLDAMPYTEESLGGGGQPLMRSNIRACGGSVNQHLWSPGSSPFLDTVAGAGHALGSPAGFAELLESRRPGRIVSRGPGKLDWYLGSAFDPVSVSKAKGWVGSRAAILHWPSDSVVEFRWEERAPLELPSTRNEVAVLLGPLRTCANNAQDRMFAAHHARFPSVGDVRAVGVLPDPIPGDPFNPEESLSLFNAGMDTVDLGPWNFGGARLRRSEHLPPQRSLRLTASEFEDWPGMTNSGGSLVLDAPWADDGLEVHWHPCDHEAPAYADTGLELTWSANSGEDWHTKGRTQHDEEPVSLVGYGCVPDLLREHWIGLDIHVNRYAPHLPDRRWNVTGAQSGVVEHRIPDQPRSFRLKWDGAEDDLEGPGGVAISLEGVDWHTNGLHALCPSLVGNADPCLRLAEIMWDAEEGGVEFAELVNCGGNPIDLSGLQATSRSFPAPSDWNTWVDGSVNLVLPPGEVMAFGTCAKWVGRGRPSRGPARWSVDRWTPLNDEAGSLRIRLPSSGTAALDQAEWSNSLEGPWWWSPDGWAWVRFGLGFGDWVPAPDRGSPGRPASMAGAASCDESVWFDTGSEEGQPSIAWSFPEVVAAMEIRVVGWPSGQLVAHRVLTDLLPEGSWTWSNGAQRGVVPLPGHLLWDIRWLGSRCRGRRRWTTTP